MSTTSESIPFHIPLSIPVIRGNEWKYIKECLDSGWVSSVGQYVDRFEEVVAQYIGTKYAIATVNGTSALHISLIVSEVGFNDEVIVPTLTFIAPVNTIQYCGAVPVFMDCDPDTLCLDVQKIDEFLSKYTVQKDDGYTYNKDTNRIIKAIIPVHIFGHPVDMDRLMAICKKYNITVIEDATESLGSTYKGKMTGSIGSIGCISFNGNKLITTGGGGMVVTDDEFIAKKVKHLTTQAKSDSFEYDHDEVGYNYRLTNIQAAMGVAQMEMLDEFIATKRKNAMLYKEGLSDLKDVKFVGEEKWAVSNFWFYTIKVSKDHKDSLMKFLLAKNIQVRPIWKLIHTLSMYKNFQTYDVVEAIDAYDCYINIPCSVSLSKDELEVVIGNIKKYYA